MANDAARVWISPHFIGAGIWTSGQVWVLNPNPTQTKVTVTFYDVHGINREQKSDTLSPGQNASFAPLDAHGKLWVRIWSEQPVMPWGACEASLSILDYVPLAFYRAEPLEIHEIASVPIDQIRDLITERRQS